MVEHSAVNYTAEDHKPLFWRRLATKLSPLLVPQLCPMFFMFWHMHWSEPESALEEGWLLAELEQAYSAFRLPGQPPTHHPFAPMLSVAGRNPKTTSRRTPFLYGRRSRSLSLSQVRRTHEDHRKAHCCRDPTPFSTRVNFCGM